MMRDLSKTLQASYDHATMRHQAQHLKGKENWQQVQDIHKGHEMARLNERHSFETDYAARVADAREAIIKERGQRSYTHPAPRSAERQDRFSHAQIERQAHLRVHNAHQQTMAKIDANETKELSQLMVQSNQQPPQPSQQFQMVRQHQMQRHR